MIAVEELAVDPLGPSRVDGVVRRDPKQLLEEDSAFEIAEVLADALVGTVAIGQAALRAAIDVEHVGLLEFGLVAIAAGPEEHHARAGFEPLSPDLDRIANGEIDLLVNTPTRKGADTDEGRIRAAAVRHGVTMITTVAGARAATQAIAGLRSGTWGVTAMQDYFLAAARK